MKNRFKNNPIFTNFDITYPYLNNYKIMVIQTNIASIDHFESGHRFSKFPLREEATTVGDMVIF